MPEKSKKQQNWENKPNRLMTFNDVRRYISKLEIGYFSQECQKYLYTMESSAVKARLLYGMVGEDLYVYPHMDHWHLTSQKIGDVKVSATTMKRRRIRATQGIPPSRKRNAQRKRSLLRKRLNKLGCVLGF